jgi:ribosomal protein S19
MRSSWKLPFVSYLVAQKFRLKTEEKISIVTKLRSSTITPKMLNSTIKVYNGMKYNVLPIKEEHVGYKLGNFTVTKKRCIFKKKMKRKNKNKKGK